MLARTKLGDCGYGAVGAVVGATYPAQLTELRRAMPHTWFLVPGYGSQGGKAADVVAAFDAHGKSASTAAFRDKFKSIQNAPYDERVHSGMAVADSPANAKGAIYVVSHVDVPPPRKDEVIAALNPLAEQSRKGAGNLRFDVWQQTSRPNHFTVVEAWKDQKAYDARGPAAPQRQFRDKLGPMLGALYDERLYRSVD